MATEDPVPLPEAAGWQDDVIRMLAFLGRHEGVRWVRPERADGSLEPDLPQRAAWEEDGETVTVRKERLGELCGYLEARFEQ